MGNEAHPTAVNLRDDAQNLANFQLALAGAREQLVDDKVIAVFVIIQCQAAETLRSVLQSNVEPNSLAGEAPDELANASIVGDRFIPVLCIRFDIRLGHCRYLLASRVARKSPGSSGLVGHKNRVIAVPAAFRSVLALICALSIYVRVCTASDLGEWP